MKKNKAERIAADVIMLLCGVLILLFIFFLPLSDKWFPFLPAFAGVFMLFVFFDLCYQLHGGERQAQYLPDIERVRQLILLDEYDKPVKSWDMTGRVSLIIGRAGQEEVDVDLDDCEYSSFIDCQHAALNFTHDGWYVEDLESQNGIKVKKVEDGQCYRVLGRPCRLSAGDILYIANTRLLLS